MELAEGRLIGTRMPRHRHQEWIKFLKLIDSRTLNRLDLHLIVDNCATHKHPKAQQWLKRHPRFHGHFTPTASSWLNLVDAIRAYVDGHSRDPKSSTWTAKAGNILAKARRARAVLDKVQTG